MHVYIPHKQVDLRVVTTCNFKSFENYESKFTLGLKL